MSTIENIVRRINKELVPQFEARLNEQVLYARMVNVEQTTLIS
jgi:hypothetical protein